MEKKQSLIMTVGAVVLIAVVVLVAAFANKKEDADKGTTAANGDSAIDAAQTVASALYEGGKDELFKSEADVIEESTGPVHYPDVEYDYSLWSRVPKKFMRNYIRIQKKRRTIYIIT